MILPSILADQAVRDDDATHDVPPGALSVTIIGTPISHYVQTVILTCEEKSVDYRLQVEGHDHPAVLGLPDHLQWHPFGKIPALRHQGQSFFETSAICRYIDLAFSESSLVPTAPAEAALMEQWISSVNSYYHTPCISHLVSQYVFPRGKQGVPDKQVINAALPAVQSAIQLLSSAYTRSPYLVGERLSLADLFIVPIILQMRRTPEGQVCLRQFPAIEERLRLIECRPSVVKMLELNARYLPAAHCLLD